MRPNFIFISPENLYKYSLVIYKGKSAWGGKTWRKGLRGERGVQQKRAKSGRVRKTSSTRERRLMTKIPSSVKCKCPVMVIKRPSKKSYARRGTCTSSKYCNQTGGN